jgi:mannose-6-phosphate isomerase-like protein (cupin superfamily)
MLEFAATHGIEVIVDVMPFDRVRAAIDRVRRRWDWCSRQAARRNTPRPGTPYMPQKQLAFGKGFRVSLRNARAQAATMVLAPGDAEGGPDNRHRGADQWLYVLSGKGRATVNGRRHSLRAGILRSSSAAVRTRSETPAGPR